MRVLHRVNPRGRSSRPALVCASVLAGALALATPGAQATNAAATGTAGIRTAATDGAATATAGPGAKAGSWKILEPANTGIPGDYVYSVAVDAKGNPWMTGDDPIWDEGGLGELKGTKWRQWTNVDGKSPEHFMRQLKFDADGHAWAGGPAGLMELKAGKVRAVWTQQKAG